MDFVRNPFAPGAGRPPPELAGRMGLMDDLQTSLRRVTIGRPTQSSIFVGLRGVGKTVVLVKAKAVAEELGYTTIAIEAHEGRKLPDLLLPGLLGALHAFSMREGAKDLARRGIRVLKSFLNGIKVSVSGIELTIEAEAGAADSGSLEVDLPNLVVAVAQAARAAQRPLAILIDELQYLPPLEFSALIMAMHQVAQQNLPVILIGAGLPQVLGVAGKSKSYAERLFRYPQIGALSQADGRDAILKPVLAEAARIDEDAIAEILRISVRYPYFIQQWSYDSWNMAQDDRITRDDVTRANAVSIAALDGNFFRVRYDRCTRCERRYMRALATFGEGAHRSGDIAGRLGLRSQALGPVRSSLIKKGMIYAPAHGDTAFTVPMFDAYMVRVMPGLG